MTESAANLSDIQPSDSEQEQPPLHVAISEDNFGTLFVNGQLLKVQDGPELLGRALTEGRDDIMRGLEAFRERMQAATPGAEIVLPPFQVVKLGETYREVLSKAGQAQAKNGPLLEERGVLKEDFTSLWDVVMASGYTPQVRAYGRNRWIGLWAQIPTDTQPMYQH